MRASRVSCPRPGNRTAKAAAVPGGRLPCRLLSARTWHRLEAAPPACCWTVRMHAASITVGGTSRGNTAPDCICAVTNSLLHCGKCLRSDLGGVHDGDRHADLLATG